MYLAAILDFGAMLLGEGKFAKGVGKDQGGDSCSLWKDLSQNSEALLFSAITR